MSDYSMLINGKSVGAEGSIEVVNPATEAAIATVPEASLAQLDDAVAAARRALPGWSAHSMDERRALILKIADRLEENIGELAQLLSEEQGKPIEISPPEIVDFANIELERPYMYIDSTRGAIVFHAMPT